MELHFLQPWLVIAAAAISVAAGAIGWRTRRAAPMLFALAAGAFFLSGARPQIGTTPAEVRHALVIDVSGSMDTRKLDIDSLLQAKLPAGHTFVRFELSDAVRTAGGAHGQGTNYARMADIASDPEINGEIVLITDGQGPLEELYSAVSPRRLILLRAPKPKNPDASVVNLSAPSTAAAGSNVEVRATIRCDADSEVPWRLLAGSEEVASGSRKVAAGVPATISRAYLVPEGSMIRLRFVLALPDDREPRNDEASVAILLGGKRRIAYCSRPGIDPDTDGMLSTLRLDEQNEVTMRETLPLTRAELENVDVVFINNLPLHEARTTREQLSDLADWINEGGSLFMLGTDGAFGPGGYRASPLEPLMPVRFRPEDAPPRRTLLLLDISSSMNDPLPGGGSKLAKLKQAATRVLDMLGADDRAAVAGFRHNIRGDVQFASAGDDSLAGAIAGLEAGGSTHIGTSLGQAAGLFEAAGEGSRILMITDGQDVEKAGEAAFRAIAADLGAKKVRLDIVLTSEDEAEWTNWLPNAHLWPVGDAGFEGLFDTLDQAMAGGDAEWVVEGEFAAGDAMLPRFVRCGWRHESSVRTGLGVNYADRNYPLVAWRRLVGRTACLCTDSWGSAKLAEFWGDEGFQQALSQALEFCFENAGQINLVLNPLPEGAELVWTGTGEAPATDLRLEPSGTARLESPGRWLLDWPVGEELRVFDRARLLQRIPLPRLVPAELRATGDDEVFFTIAEEGGVRVFSSLEAWKPRRVVDSAEQPTDITWAPALLAMILLLAGFAVRRR